MPVLADVGSATFALVLALAVTIGLILWHTQRQWSRTYGRWRYREELEEPSFHSGVTSEELARWEVRMHELVRDLQGQLNSKIALVAELVAEAERASRKLEELLQQAGNCVCQSGAPSPLRTDSANISPGNISSAGAVASREVSEPAHNLSNHPTISPKTSPQKDGSRLNGHPSTQWNFSNEFPSDTAGHPSHRAEPPLGERATTAEFSEPATRCTFRVSSANSTEDLSKEKNRQSLGDSRLAGNSGSQTNPGDSSGRFAAVLRLYDLGLPPEEIARQTGLGLGEVELILRLRRTLHPDNPIVSGG